MQNYFFHFLTFFITGLAVNLTPCVYPMLTVTVSLFKPTQGQQINLIASFGRAFVYVLGMAVMYSSLGIFAAMTGALFGGILQNKWIVLTVAILVLGLALSMFGIFQLRVPTGLLQKLESLRKIRFFGLFFAGMFVGIFAAPCIGPPVLALLTSVADRADPFFGFLSFFIFSLGLGFPYLVLGTFSGLLKKIPKAGSWLVWVEHAFGVILLGFSFYYFVIVINSEFVKWVLPVTLILGGIYLGFIEKSGKEKPLFVRLKWGAGLASLGLGILLITTIVTPKESLGWDQYEFSKVFLAKEKKQPVVIDFYADWCITCHEFENFVFMNSVVAKELKKFVRLRVDATDMMAPAVQEVVEQYHVFGLPMIVFLDENGEEVEDARVAGYVPPEEFLKSIQIALRKVEE
ncbi:MAG: thioredoxin family protein [Candidatus Omnitrophica bacterium]|nr:thioredoxin family protein [Candidatus Omnitrophota bacterium]